MRRTPLTALLAALLVTLSTASPAAAQDSITNSSITEGITFGQVIHLAISAQATTVFTEARLALQWPGHPEIIEPLDVPPSAIISAAYDLDVRANHLPPFAEVTYHWELATLGGATLVTEPSTLRYLDNRFDWEWQPWQSGNVVVQWDGEERGVARLALDTATESLSQTNTLLGTTYEAPLYIFIYPDLDSLNSGLALHDLAITDRVPALAMPEQSLILMAETPLPQLVTDVQQNLPHALTHVVIGQTAGANAGRVPGWFEEGLAVMASPAPDTALQVALEGAARNGTLMPLESLCVHSYGTLQPSEATLAYAESESVMRYVTDQFGSAGAQNLLAAYAGGAECGAGVEQALGITLAALDDSWRGDLQNQLTVQLGPQSVPTPLLPWLLLLGISLALALPFVAIRVRLKRRRGDKRQPAANDSTETTPSP